MQTTDSTTSDSDDVNQFSHPEDIPDDTVALQCGEVIDEDGSVIGVFDPRNSSFSLEVE